MNIFITQRVVKNSTYPELRDCLAHDWHKFANHNSISLLPLPTDIAQSKRLINNIESKAVIFSGGNDLVSYKDTKENRTREKFEEQLFNLIINNKIPIIAICHGTQLYCQRLGLKLLPFKRITQSKDIIKVDQEFPLDKVNSYYNYAPSPEGLPSSIDILALSKDGTIEAAHDRENNIIFWMFHPERSNNHDGKAFINYSLKKLGIR